MTSVRKLRKRNHRRQARRLAARRQFVATVEAASRFYSARLEDEAERAAQALRMMAEAFPKFWAVFVGGLPPQYRERLERAAQERTP